MASFVYVGDYSTACACKVRSNAHSESGQSLLTSDDGALVAAAAGVELEQRSIEAQRRAAAAHGRVGIGPR